MTAGPRSGLVRLLAPLRVKSLALCSLVAAVTLQSGCRAKSDRKPTFPVRGKVMYQNQPAAGAIVTLIPTPDLGAPKPHGKAGADGVFQMSTYELNDGAPTGRYGVTITWPGPNPRSQGAGDEELQGPDRLAGRYGNPQAPVREIQVGDRPLELDPLELQ